MRPKSRPPAATAALTLPYDLDAERVVLGTLLSDIFRDEAIQHIDELTEADFYDHKHRAIFKAILELLNEGARVEPLLIQAKTGGEIKASELIALRDAACIPSQISHYVNILHTKQRGRRLVKAIQNATVSYLQGVDYAEIEEFLLNTLSKQRAAAKTSTLAEEVDLETFLAGEEIQPGVLTGIDELDVALGGGIRPGELCIVAARTSIGKSALAVMVAIHAAECGWPVLYMSYEMPKSQIWKRALSYESRVSLRKFRDGYFDDFDKQRIRKAYNELLPVMKRIRVNTEANTPAELARLVKLEQIKGGAKFLIVDHAGRMKSDTKTRSDYEKMTEIAHRLKDIAIQLNIPLLVLWQLNREVEMRNDRKPTLADLRDSGQAEEVADFVLLLYRDNYYNKDIPIQLAEVTVSVAKARDGGQVGDIKIPWLRIISRPEEFDEEPPF